MPGGLPLVDATLVIVEMQVMAGNFKRDVEFLEFIAADARAHSRVFSPQEQGDMRRVVQAEASIAAPVPIAPVTKSESF